MFSLDLFMAEVGGCSLAFGEGVPVLVLAWPVVTGPEPASRLAVLQGPPKAIVELKARDGANQH